MASDDQPKMITRKKDQSIECCSSSQTVSTSQTAELLTKTFLLFLKNRIFYVSDEFLAKSSNQNNPFKFVTNNGKGFSMDMVSGTSFMILVYYHSLNYKVNYS